MTFFAQRVEADRVKNNEFSRVNNLSESFTNLFVRTTSHQVRVFG